MVRLSNPPYAERGEGDHAKHGGGEIRRSCPIPLQHASRGPPPPLPMGRIWRGLLFPAALFRNDSRLAFHSHGQANDEAGAALRSLAVGAAGLALVPLPT